MVSGHSSGCSWANTCAVFGGLLASTSESKGEGGRKAAGNAVEDSFVGSSSIISNSDERCLSIVVSNLWILSRWR